MVARAVSLLAVTVSLLASACSQREAAPSGPTASYRLDVSPAAIEVTLRVSGVAKAALVSPGPVERMRVEGLRFEGADGRPLAPRRTAETSFARDDVDGSEVARTVESFRLEPAPSSFTLRYRVRPGHSESGVLSGFLGPSGALFSGDQVFYSMTSEPPAELRVEIGSLPKGWIAEGLPADADGRVAAPPGTSAWRALLSSPVRLGPPRADPDPASPPREVLDAFGSARVLLAELPPGARRIDVSAGPLAVGLEAGPWTERRRQRLARLLVSRFFLADDRQLRNEDQWLTVAAPIFLAAGAAWPSLEARLYREHAATFPGTGANLAESFRPGARGAAAVRRLRGPLVLGLLDAKLGGGGAAFLRAFLEGPPDVRQKGFSSALREKLGDAEAIPFLDRFVGRGALPLGRASESLPDLAPEPAAGAGAPAREVTVLVTGAGRGYLESCGCQEVPAGGAARRGGVIDAVRQERGADAPVLVLDAGDFLPYADPLVADDVARRLEETIVETMNAMGVAAAAVGANEILAGPERLAALARAAGFPLLSANASRAAEPARPFAPAADLAGFDAAVFGATGWAPLRAHADYVDGALERAGLAIGDPVDPLVAAVTASSAPLRIVIGAIAPERIRALVERAPEIDLVVSTDDLLLRDGAPPRGRDRSGYLGTTLVLYATAGDVALDRIDLALDSAGRVAGHAASVIQLVPGTKESARVAEIVGRFRDFAIARRLEGAAPPEPLPGDAALLALPGNGFTGGAACVACHADAHAKWAGSEHAGALETLRRVRRDLDPSCLACHVTHLRFESKRPAFEEGVACEACHGPGALHAKEPERKDLLVGKPVAPGRCRACHTTARNPSFEGRYPEMLEAIRHWPDERR